MAQPTLGDRFEGRVALVTGSSRNLGAAIARRLADLIRSHRSTIVTRVHTDEGVVGEAYAGDEDVTLAAIDRIIRREIAPRLEGRDALAVEQCWELARPATYDILRDRRLGLVACACVDTAIWDAVGKALGQPLWKLWGGFRRSLPMIAIGGYFGLLGRDVMALSSGVSEDSPAKEWEDRVFFRRFVKDATRSSDVTTKFWDFMRRTTGKYQQAVATYDEFLKQRSTAGDTQAADFLAKLPENQRALVTLRSAGNAAGAAAGRAGDTASCAGRLVASAICPACSSSTRCTRHGTSRRPAVMAAANRLRPAIRR